METVALLSFPQETTTESVLSHMNPVHIFCQLRLGLHSGHFPSDFATEILY